MKLQHGAKRLARFMDFPVAVKAQKLRSRVVGSVLGRLYIDLNHSVDKSLLISGTPRSGSTWLANLLGEMLGYRLVFEPLTHGTDGIERYEARYLRVEASDQELQERFERLLTGAARDRALDTRNRQALARGRLVKGVATNLLLSWFQRQFPSVPVVYIVRHPLLVVSSYLQMSWLDPKPPEHWLEQDELMTDHLAPFEAVIASADTRLKQSALEWCVLNYVPMRQEHSPNLVQVRYEELVQEPQRVLNDLSIFLGLPERVLDAKRIETPSHTAESSVADRSSLMDAWRLRLSEEDVLEVDRFVREFGFDEYRVP
jgi:hypothetical protein